MSSTTARRLRVEGDLYHPRVPAGAVYVGRATPGLRRSPYANPHTLRAEGCRHCGQAHTRAEVIDLYRAHIADHPELVDRARRELAGRDLACWCRLDDPCHADVLLDVVGSATP